MNIDDLLRRLFSLTYHSESGYEFKVISGKSETQSVEDEIRSWAKAQDNAKELLEKDREIAEINKKIGELEAKVYVYETVIANSNFAPILKEES